VSSARPTPRLSSRDASIASPRPDALKSGVVPDDMGSPCYLRDQGVGGLDPDSPHASDVTKMD